MFCWERVSSFFPSNSASAPFFSGFLSIVLSPLYRTSLPPLDYRSVTATPNTPSTRLSPRMRFPWRFLPLPLERPRELSWNAAGASGSRTRSSFNAAGQALYSRRRTWKAKCRSLREGAPAPAQAAESPHGTTGTAAAAGCCRCCCCCCRPLATLGKPSMPGVGSPTSPQLLAAARSRGARICHVSKDLRTSE